MTYANAGGLLTAPPTQGPQVPSPAPAPAPTFGSVVQSDINSPNYAQGLLGGIAGGYAPTVAAQGFQGATAQAGLGEVAPTIGIGAANATENAGYSYADALLSEQGNQLQQQGLAQQAGTAAQQQAIEQGQFGVGQQQLAQQQAELTQAYPQEQQQLSGAAAASGTTNTAGAREATTNLAQQSGPGGFAEQSLYLQNQLAQLGQQSEQAGYQGSEEQIANQRAQLANAAQANGLSVQQTTSQLQYGLAQLGITGESQQNALINQAQSAQTGQAGDYGAILSQAALIGGLSPQSFAGVG